MNKAFSTQRTNGRIDPNSKNRHEELDDHPMSSWGFSKPSDNQFIRLTPEIMSQAILTLLRFRIGLYCLDIKPQEKFTEEKIYSKDKRFWDKSIFDKAKEISDLFLRDSSVAGFKLEYHNFETVLTTHDRPQAITASLTLYRVEHNDLPVPVSITLDWNKP